MLAADPSELTPTTHYSPAGLGADWEPGEETVDVIGLEGGLSHNLCFGFRAWFYFEGESLACINDELLEEN